MRKQRNPVKSYREKLRKIFEAYGFRDYKWVSPKKIVISTWVRMKCLFGCPMYGRNASCPPNLPSIPECREFFSEYQDAVVFHFEKKVNRPEDRAAWTRQINLRLVKLEREVFLSGYEKAFVLPIDCCDLCDECSGDKGRCKNSKMSRPAIEAFGVDVYRTVRKIGYPIQVLSDYSQPMNRYALLMIR